MKKEPVKSVRFMLIILGVLVLALPIISMVEKKKTPEWMVLVVLLFCSMSVVDAAFRHQQKRIDALEEKLNNQNQPKE